MIVISTASPMSGFAQDRSDLIRRAASAMGRNKLIGRLTSDPKPKRR